MLWERHPGCSVFISFSDNCHTIVMQLYAIILTNSDFFSIYQEFDSRLTIFKRSFIFV